MCIYKIILVQIYLTKNGINQISSFLLKQHSLTINNVLNVNLIIKY